MRARIELITRKVIYAQLDVKNIIDIEFQLETRVARKNKMLKESKVIYAQLDVKNKIDIEFQLETRVARKNRAHY